MKIEELNNEECLDLLKCSGLGRIACSLNDQPYVVPFYFVYETGEYLYAFSTIGQKIVWMRQNPLVCIEFEEIKSQNDWTTLIIFGLFEELPDKPEFKERRKYAHELLARRPMWWQPASVSGAHRGTPEETPVYFRVHIKEITGHRAIT
jgi:nitroimidazol reductase NimA-like FMN-containing flavoprotein (pyridoxamine 5'-phosphate oxidase superfamily)